MKDLPKILIVEDDLNTARPLAALLQRRGFEVRTASSAQQVRLVLSDFVPDAAVCDYMLDGDEDGAYVARSLAEQVPDMRIIFLSTFPVSHLRRQLGDLPVDGLLTKPASVSEILACLLDSRSE